MKKSKPATVKIDERGYRYEVEPNGSVKLVITDRKKTQNLPPPPPDFEGIRIENGKPKFYHSAASQKLYKTFNQKKKEIQPPPEQEKEPETAKPKFGWPRAWDSLTLEEKDWVRRVTGRDGAEPVGGQSKTNPTKEAKSPNTSVANGTEVQVSMSQGSEGGKRYNIYGHVVTAVIRWMGKDAWTFQQARKAMRKLNLPVAEATLHAQLRAGVKGERGDPAKLTSDEIEKLYALIEDQPCPTTTTDKSPTLKNKASASSSPPARSAEKTKPSTAPSRIKVSSSSRVGRAATPTSSKLKPNRKKARKR